MKLLPKVFPVFITASLVLGIVFSVQAESNKQETESETEYVMPIEAARAAGLGAEINQTVTIDDVSVTLDYVYADVREIQVFAVVESSRGQIDISHHWMSRLSETGSMGFRRHGEGGRLAEDVALTPIIKSFRFTPLYSAEELAAQPDELEMTFVMSTLIDPVRAPEATVDVSPESTREPEPLPDYTFEFNFTIPFYQAIEKEVNETRAVDGASVTLNSVATTPISVELELCAVLPHKSYWKLQEAALVIDGEPNVVYGRSYFFPYEECKRFLVDAFAGLEPQELEFQIEAFGEDLFCSAAISDIDWEGLLPVLQENGLKITLDKNGLPHTIDSIPPGNSADYVEVLNELGVGERIEGPWVFEVDLQ
jgi:hypothetical protein